MLVTVTSIVVVAAVNEVIVLVDSIHVHTAAIAFVGLERKLVSC